MAASDPAPTVPTPTGGLQGAAVFSWDGSTWQPAGAAYSSVATPTGVLRGVAPFSYSGGAWQPAGQFAGALDRVAVYTWSGTAWTPAGGAPEVPTQASGVLQGVAAFTWDGTAWQPAGQAAPEVATPSGVLAGMAMFSWSGTAWMTAAVLDLNFLSGALDPRITFTRASTATYFNSAGVMQTAAINVPRFDYNPSTLSARGLLMEEGRTNYAYSSGNLANTTYYGFTASSGAANQAVAPDGTITMTRLAEDSSNATHWVNSGPGIPASSICTTSLYARAQQNRYLQVTQDDTANGSYATFDLQAGVVSGAQTTYGTGTALGASITPVGGGTYRITLCGQLTGTTGRIGFVLSNAATPGFLPAYQGNPTNGLLIWGAQLEVGAWATSYLPTTTAQLSRAADIATMPVGSWYKSGVGTLLVNATTEYSAASYFPGFAALDDGTGNNRVDLNGGGAGLVGVNIVAAGTSQYGNNFSGVVSGTPFKAAAAWSSGAAAMGAAMGTATTGGGTAAPTLTELVLGGGVGTNAMSGWLRNIRYWSRQLSSAELQQVTT